MTTRDKLGLVGFFGLTYCILVIGLSRQACASGWDTWQGIVSDLLGISIFGLLAFYWFVWVWLSEEKFKEHKCVFLIALAALLVIARVAYTHSLCTDGSSLINDFFRRFPVYD